jgi:hypothetical protein
MNARDFAMPRVIYSLWLQGEKQAPDIVRLVFQRWSSLNPNYELRILDGEDVDELLRGLPIAPRVMTVQALSDVARMGLLVEGGVWVDATVFPIAPLDSWLPDVMKDSGFFAFERPGVDRPVASWFIAAEPNHLLTTKWWREVKRFWSKPRSLATYDGEVIPPNPIWEVTPDGGAMKDEHPYFWFHYLFAYLLDNDADFATNWKSCSKWWADPPAYRLQALLQGDKQPSNEAIAETARCEPMHKLNWRHKYPLDILAALPSSFLMPSPPAVADHAVEQDGKDVRHDEERQKSSLPGEPTSQAGRANTRSSPLGTADRAAPPAPTNRHNRGMSVEDARLISELDRSPKTAAAGKSDQAPRLLDTFKGFNVVRVAQLYVAAAQDLGPMDIAAILANTLPPPPAEKFIIAHDRSSLYAAIDAYVREAASAPPRLLHTHKSYNIVSVGELYVAAAQDLGPIDIGTVLANAAPRPPATKFITAHDIPSLEAAIDACCGDSA